MTDFVTLKKSPFESQAMSLNAAEIACALVLQTAVESDLGIIVRTTDPVKARASLYKVRNLLNDASLSGLSIRVSPDNSEGAIWILTERGTGAVALDIAAI